MSTLGRTRCVGLQRACGVALLGAMALAPAAAAQDVLVKEITEPPDWTAEQYQSAEPLDLPLAAASVGELRRRAEEDLRPLSSGVQVSAPGYAVPEANAVDADTDAWLFPEPLDEAAGDDGFQPLDAEAIEPLDFGEALAFYSSSRLVPNGARRYYPYRTIGKLFFRQPGIGFFVCSGAVLRKRLILTAGHCVHSGSDGVDGFFEDFVFVPAYQEGNAPYGVWEAAVVWTTNSWATGGGLVPNRADFGIIELGDERFRKGDRKVRKRIGDVTGTLGYRTNALLPNHTKQVGYPVAYDLGEIMHQVDSQSFAAFDLETVLYGNDMSGGSSGGPWIENFGRPAGGQTGGGQPFPNLVVGVASFGFIPPPDFKLAGSSILNDEFLALVDAACARRADNC